MALLSTITLTLGDQAENHVGMQKIGTLADSGFNYDDLITAKSKFETNGYICELINLTNYVAKKYKASDAYILVIRNGVNYFTDKDKLLDEQNKLTPDKKAFMYGRVVNKNARYNLCFDTNSQEPDYENGKGRIVAYSTVPLLTKIRDNLHNFLGTKANELTIEGNYYYDIKKCYIGYHGDTERKKVIAIRLGASFPLYYQWFCRGEAIGRRVTIKLNHGDMYVMSEKATGFDWKLKTIPTLRHAAGSKKLTEIKKKVA